MPFVTPGPRKSRDAFIGAVISQLHQISMHLLDELHTLIDTVVVSWDDQKEHHELEIRGKLLELLAKGKPAGEAGFVANGDLLP